MRRVVLAKPAALVGDNLRAELLAAGIDASKILLSEEAGVPVIVFGVPDSSSDTTIASVVAAHTGQLSAGQIAVGARAADTDAALTQLIAQAGGTANVRTKLKAVLAGTDTLTPAQMQRLLAAVALAEIRDRSDT